MSDSIGTRVLARTSILGLATLLLGGVGCSSIDDADTFEGSGGTDGVSDSGYPHSSSDSASGGTGGGWDSDTSDPSGGTSSAGDTADGEPEPDDQDPYGTTGGPEECDDQTPVELFLSPDDSNSMSSPVQAREAILDGWTSLSGVPLRTWEFLNYYTFDYPAAEPGALTVTPTMYRDETMPEGEYLLQIGVASEEVSNDLRAPLNITLVLDTSGSMGGAPMDMLKESCRAIASSLREGDEISMVTWNTSNAILMGGYKVSGPNDSVLLEQVNALEAGGGTDLHGGLTAGYDLALQAYDAGRINRIVLVSDGGANAGVTEEELIAEHAGNNEQDGIYMVGVGVGNDATYNDLLMDTVTDVGKGASVFISSEEEAWKIFSERFVNTLAVAARDVQVRLDLPPGFEIVRFSGEEFSSDPQEVEPQHIAPNDAMVFHQRIATCAPDLVDDTASVTVAVHYKDAVTFEEKEITTQMTFGELLAADQTQLRKGAAIFEYAESLKAYRDELDYGAIEVALGEVAAALELLPGDPDLLEVQQVLQGL